MMLQVTKLIGEGFDFATGRDITLGIAISNGKIEAIIPIDQQSAQVIVELFKGAVQQFFQEKQPEVSEKQELDGPEQEDDEYRDELTGAGSI